jgi:hypothetical protein
MQGFFRGDGLLIFIVLGEVSGRLIALFELVSPMARGQLLS